MAGCGYRKSVEFRELRRRWDSLDLPIPRVYFTLIGVDYEALDSALVTDQEEFDRALSEPFFPDRYAMRPIPYLELDDSLARRASPIESWIRVMVEQGTLQPEMKVKLIERRKNTHRWLTVEKMLEKLHTIIPR